MGYASAGLGGVYQNADEDESFLFRRANSSEENSYDSGVYTLQLSPWHGQPPAFRQERLGHRAAQIVHDIDHALFATRHCGPTPSWRVYLTQSLIRRWLRFTLIAPISTNELVTEEIDWFVFTTSAWRPL
jgi:hypothetical protein